MPTDRVSKVIAMTSAQIGNGFNPDAGHIVGMLDARFPPCSDFDCMNELGTNIEKWQFRLAPKRVASGQFREDGCRVRHSYTSDLARL